MYAPKFWQPPVLPARPSFASQVGDSMTLQADFKRFLKSEDEKGDAAAVAMSIVNQDRNITGNA
jgi:hypothetical protein